MEASQPLLERFFHLCGEWSRLRPRGGGAAALAGFDFQLAAALVEMVRRFDMASFHRHGSAPSGDVFLEALSDIAVQQGGLIVVTQAKLTLQSGTLKHALDELWAIDQLARSATPDLVGRLRYRIATSRNALRTWETTRERWNPTGGRDEVAVAGFRNSVLCEVLPDPRLTAVELLASDFKAEDPVALVEGYIGKLLGAARTAGFHTAASEISSSLAGLLNAATKRTSEFRLWRATDQPPAEVLFAKDDRQAVRVGERLTVRDLREGLLANRAVYASVLDACETWLASLSIGAAKIPVFWIEGRSGTGKSAALLHLLAKIHGDDPSRAVLWLGTRSDATGRAVAWAGNLLRQGYQVLIGIDDPASGQQAEAFASGIRQARKERDIVYDSEVESGRQIPLPIAVVCCGPAEQREDAMRLGGGEIEITSFVLPRETRADLDELAAFFHARTGRDPPTLEGDVLLVQRFFEWEKGRIDDFARSFRTRLLNFDADRPQKKVFETVARILAFGRLYIDYPADPIESDRAEDATLDRAFVLLARDQTHFVFDVQDEMDRARTVRLTHPHLADAIYRVWFEADGDRVHRRAHLQSGFESAIARQGLPIAARLAPLWAVARLSTGRSPGHDDVRDLTGRLDLVREDLRRVLPGLYLRARLVPAYMPLTDLPVWTDLDAYLELYLQPSPIAVLAGEIAHATAPRPGLRLACHKLLEHRERHYAHLNAADMVAGLLYRLSGWQNDNGSPWHDWAALAEDFIRKCGVRAIGDAVRRFITAAPASRQVTNLVGCLAATLAADQDSVPILLSWLDVARTSLPSWPGVLGDIYDQDGRSAEFDRLAIRFLAEQPAHGSWSYFWEYLWKENRVDGTGLEERALVWLRARTVDQSDGGWKYVWEALWAAAKDDTRRDALLAMADDRLGPVIN